MRKIFDTRYERTATRLGVPRLMRISIPRMVSLCSAEKNSIIIDFVDTHYVRVYMNFFIFKRQILPADNTAVNKKSPSPGLRPKGRGIKTNGDWTPVILKANNPE